MSMTATSDLVELALDSDALGHALTAASTASQPDPPVEPDVLFTGEPKPAPAEPDVLFTGEPKPAPAEPDVLFTGEPADPSTE